MILMNRTYSIGATHGNCYFHEMCMPFLFMHRRTERCDYGARSALLQWCLCPRPSRWSRLWSLRLWLWVTRLAVI